MIDDTIIMTYIYAMELQAYLINNKIPQKKIAETIGVSQATISHWLRGKYVPERENAKRIEAATNGEVTAASLLGLEKNNTNNNISEHVT